MKKTIKYQASAMAKVRLGNTKWKTIQLPNLDFSDKGKLLSVIADSMYDNNGECDLYTKGVVLRIEKTIKIDDEDEVFITKEYEFECVGNLMDSEYFEMQDELLNKTK